MTGTSPGAGLPRPVPAPPSGGDDDAIIAAIRAILPERSAEDRARGVIHVSFGSGDAADSLTIPVLPSGRNREWQSTFRATWSGLLDDLEGDDTGAVVMRALTGEPDRQIDLLEAYNPAMLSRAFLESTATEEQVLEAFLGVTAAAFPLPVRLARVVLGNRDVAKWVRLQLVRMLYSSSTSSSPPSTDGTRDTSTGS